MLKLKGEPVNKCRPIIAPVCVLFSLYYWRIRPKPISGEIYVVSQWQEPKGSPSQSHGLSFYNFLRTNTGTSIGISSALSIFKQFAIFFILTGKFHNNWDLCYESRLTLFGSTSNLTEKLANPTGRMVGSFFKDFIVTARNSAVWVGKRNRVHFGPSLRPSRNFQGCQMTIICHDRKSTQKTILKGNGRISEARYFSIC